MRAVSSCQELKTQSFVEPEKFEIDSESDRVSNIRVSWYVFRSIRKFIRRGLAGGCSAIPSNVRRCQDIRGWCRLRASVLDSYVTRSRAFWGKRRLRHSHLDIRVRILQHTWLSYYLVRRCRAMASLLRFSPTPPNRLLILPK